MTKCGPLIWLILLTLHVQCSSHIFPCVRPLIHSAVSCMLSVPPQTPAQCRSLCSTMQILQPIHGGQFVGVYPAADTAISLKYQRGGHVAQSPVCGAQRGRERQSKEVKRSLYKLLLHVQLSHQFHFASSQRHFNYYTLLRKWDREKNGEAVERWEIEREIERGTEIDRGQHIIWYLLQVLPAKINVFCPGQCPLVFYLGRPATLGFLSIFRSIAKL